jgi:VWFA-related protein
MRILSVPVSVLLAAVGFSSIIRTPAHSDQPATIRLDVNLVQVQAMVTDSGGRAVSGLRQEAFRVYVDDQLQPITDFHGEDAPVTAGIVIDNSASMSPKRTEVIAAAIAFARASNPRDQMFVVHFNERARLGLPEGKQFTGEAKELEAAISHFDLGGTTALYDALMLAMSQFKGAAFPRKTLLIITDGGDNSSKASLPEVLKAAQTAGVGIFSIGLFDEGNSDRNPQVLKQLAEVTGGRVFLPAAVSDTKVTCEEIAREIRSQYTLGFPGAEDGKFHHISVTAQDPSYGSLQVRTRTGYVAVKPPTP